MTELINKVKDESAAWDARPMPDLGVVVARGKRTRRRRQAGMVGGAAAVMVAGAMAFGLSGGLGTQGAPAPAARHTSGTDKELPRLTYDWPQGYTPTDTPVYGPDEVHPTWPEGTVFHTVKAGELPVAQRGPLAGVKSAEVTLALAPAGDRTSWGFYQQRVFLAGGKDGRVLTVDDRLSKGQMASVRALALAYTPWITPVPVGTAQDLLGWTLPDGSPVGNAQVCPEADGPDPAKPSDTARDRSHCVERFTNHPNTMLVPSQRDMDRLFQELEAGYVPCVKAKGLPLVAENRTQWKTWVAKNPEKANNAFVFTDIPSTSSEAQPYLQCYPSYDKLVPPLLKDAKNPTM